MRPVCCLNRTKKSTPICRSVLSAIPYVGYRYFDIAAVTPRYRFGFGLGYTDFAVENTAVRVRGDEICVQVNVRNVGASAGKEVVQLYVSAPDGVPDQPYQELRGYAKTRELYARESEMLEITVRASDLSSFDETQSAYVLAAGTYWLRIGTSSDAANIVAGLRLGRSALRGCGWSVCIR